MSCNLPISAITGTDIMYGGDNNSVSITNGISNYNNFFGSGNTISVSGLAKTSAMYNIVLGKGNSVDFKGAEEAWQYSLIIGQNNSVSYSTYMGKASAYNIICGVSNTIDKNISNCFVMGAYNKPKKKFNTNIGDSLNTTNDYEFALATCNVSSSATTSFGNSGNTLFSVGNGKSNSSRHNAIDIRQNGDIYIADTNDTSTTNYYEKPMIKLQDALGGGGSSYTAGDGIDINNDVISVTGKVDTSAFTAHTADTVIHVTSAEKAAWNGKQDALVSGTNIKTINGESILGEGNITIQGGSGGGKAIEAGTNISVTTGETADTINCTLPYYKLNGEENYSIYGQTDTSFKNKATYAYQSLFIGFSNEVKGTSSSMSYYSNYVIGNNNKINGVISNYVQGYNIVIGDHNSLSGENLSYSYVIGQNNSGYTSNTLLTGWNNQTYNDYESAFGRYNASNTGSTDADKSIFSVGNGTSTSARHNAFEIRKNGDIYCSDGTNDVKLQDTITATAANTTALGGLKLVKLTQSEYDSLTTKDNSTLYVIVN